MKHIIDNIVAVPASHARWLNTLSMMENVGAKKIKNCEDPVFVSEIILKHSAEEARHAYYLKKQISKILENACPTYEGEYLLAPQSSYQYLHALDVQLCRYLRDEFSFSGPKIKYAAYLLVTYAIEVRADGLYPIYQEVLTAHGSQVTVKSIIAEEKNHLAEMTDQLRQFSSEWEAMTKRAIELEEQLFKVWEKDLERVVSTTNA